MTTIHLHETGEPKSPCRRVQVDGPVAAGDLYIYNGVRYAASKPVTPSVRGRVSRASRTRSSPRCREPRGRTSARNLYPCRTMAAIAVRPFR